MTDRFDSLMGPGRGHAVSAPAAPADEPFVTRARRLATAIARDGVSPAAVQQAASDNQLLVVTGWAVGKANQTPIFFLSDAHGATGRQPDGLLLAWLAGDVDGNDGDDDDVVDSVVLFTYSSESSLP